FFFQAEDGIRDTSVTGVQTCALPISRATGEVFNLTDGEPVSKRRFVGRVAELAGIRPPSRHLPLGLARFLATIVEGAAKLRGAKNPPLINKARFKFLGLNLDYSIEKART